MKLEAFRKSIRTMFGGFMGLVLVGSPSALADNIEIANNAMLAFHDQDRAIKLIGPYLEDGRFYSRTRALAKETTSSEMIGPRLEDGSFYSHPQGSSHFAKQKKQIVPASKDESF